jgi:hypothetical protein
MGTQEKTMKLDPKIVEAAKAHLCAHSSAIWDRLTTETRYELLWRAYAALRAARKVRG